MKSVRGIFCTVFVNVREKVGVCEKIADRDTEFGGDIPDRFGVIRERGTEKSGIAFFA